MFKTVRISLKGPHGSRVLRYEVRPTEAAQLWANSLRLAAADGLRERHRFYQFPGSRYSDVGRLLESLSQITARLRRHHPELRFPEIDRAGWFGIAAARVKLLKGQVPILEALLERLATQI